nr:DNA-binding protein [Variovorax sp. MHTC-1]
MIRSEVTTTLLIEVNIRRGMAVVWKYVGQMAEVRQTPSRGIQEDDVWGAADVLLHEGLRPMVERVRQKIGRGSSNTVSPVLERWRRSGNGWPAARIHRQISRRAMMLSVVFQ